MSTKWIAVLTRTDARFYTEKTFRLLHQMKNALGREKNKALTTDKPGRAPGKFVGASGMHNLTAEKDPHEDAAIHFAKEVNEYLHKQFKLNQLDELIVFAEPKMMGRLKVNMDEELVARTQWLAKNLGKATVQDLILVVAKARREGEIGFSPAGNL